MSLNPSAPPRSSSSPVYWICRGVFIESIRRREVSIIFLFVALFVIGAITARFVGSESEAAAAFILNLGLSVVWSLIMILAVLLCVRQFPDELESRSIYPLLAKPVHRFKYIAGKWLAGCLVCSATLLLLNAIVLIASPWPAGLHLGTLLQAITLEIFAVAVVAALAIMFSIRLPKSLALVITALLAFVAMPVTSLILSRFPPGGGRNLAEWLTGYIPNIGRLDLFNAFSAGAAPVTFSDFLARMVYATILVAFSLAVASALLERRSL